MGLCFPVPPVCRAALGYSAVPKGTQTYSFRDLAMMLVLVVYFFLFSRVFLFIFLILFSVNISNIICAPHSYVQVCSAATVENHCLVLSFGGLAVWLSSLLALSLWCRGHLTAAI